MGNENILGGSVSSQGIDTKAKAERTAAAYKANPPSGSKPVDPSPFQAIVLDPGDTGPTIVARLMERNAEAIGDSNNLALARDSWAAFEAEVKAVENDTSLSADSKAARLKSAFEAVAADVRGMEQYARQQDDAVVELERSVDEEDGIDIHTDDVDRATMLNALAGGRMDPTFLGKRYLAACCKPKADWSRSDGNLIHTVTKLHRSLGVEVCDPVFFEQGFNALVAQSKNAPAVEQAKGSADLMRRMAGQIALDAGRAAKRHGLDDAWAQLSKDLGVGATAPASKTRAQVLDLPTTARQRAQWGRR